MHLGRTANATISLEGSSDPENDPLTCWIETNYGFSTATDQGCPMIFDIDFRTHHRNLLLQFISLMEITQM